MTSSANPLPVVHADSADGRATSRVVQSVKSAVRAQESELKRWRRTFDANAKTVVNGEKYVPSVACSSQKPR
jgi:solute carrier family 25 aspartate/glutamate transporter 12/13